MVIPGHTERKYEPYPEYKKPGVEWLAEVPMHWDINRLKYNVNLINDKVENGDPDKPYLGLENVESWTGRIIETDFTPEIEGASNSFRKDDVLFGKLRPYLAKTVHAQHYGICTSELMVLRSRKYYARYLFYYMLSQSIVNIIDSSTYGVKMPRANWNFVGNLPFVVPPESEQQTIADFLDRETASIDALIAKKQKLIELLLEQRTAIITNAVTKGLNPDAPMKDSRVEWLGEIPAHWEIKRLKYVATNGPGAIKSGPFGSQLLTSEMSGSDVKIYNQRNVVDQDFDAGENYITQAKYLELSSFTVYSGDILITTRGTIGRCAIVPQQAPLGILHPCLMRIQPDIKKALSSYLKIIIQDSALFYAQLQYYSNATTIDVVYTDTLKNIKIPIPPLTDQQAIIDFLDQETARIDSLIGKVNEAIEKLQEHRSALITAAVTGKIDVRKEAT